MDAARPRFAGWRRTRSASAFRTSLVWAFRMLNLPAIRVLRANGEGTPRAAGAGTCAAGARKPAIDARTGRRIRLAKPQLTADAPVARRRRASRRMEKRWELYSCQVSCKVLRHTAASNNRTEAWSEHERAGHRKHRRANRHRRASVRRGRVHRGAHPGDRAAERAARRRRSWRTTTCRPRCRPRPTTSATASPWRNWPSTCRNRPSCCAASSSWANRRSCSIRTKRCFCPNPQPTAPWRT